MTWLYDALGWGGGATATGFLGLLTGGVVLVAVVLTQLYTNQVRERVREEGRVSLVCVGVWVLGGWPAMRDR